MTDKNKQARTQAMPPSPDAVAALQCELDDLRARHAAVLGSRSWRITAPVRWVGARGRCLASLVAGWRMWAQGVQRLRRAPLLGPWLVRRELIRRYIGLHGVAPRLDPPVGFNEHMLYRMLNDRDPLLRRVNDKLEVREVIRERLGADYVVPLLGVWRDPAEVDWDRLRPPFVLKPSHSSGFPIFVRDNAGLDRAELADQARRWLAEDYFDIALEWGYRGLPRRLLAEPLLVGHDGAPPVEVHVFVFSGTAAILRLMTGHKTDDCREDCFDAQGTRLPVRLRLNRLPGNRVLEPAMARRLACLAERVAAGVSHMRVDFYLTDDGLRIGELTPYTLGGTMRPDPPEWDAIMGRMWSDMSSSC